MGSKEFAHKKAHSMNEEWSRTLPSTLVHKNTGGGGGVCLSAEEEIELSIVLKHVAM